MAPPPAAPGHPLPMMPRSPLALRQAPYQKAHMVPPAPHAGCERLICLLVASIRIVGMPPNVAPALITPTMLGVPPAAPLLGIAVRTVARYVALRASNQTSDAIDDGLKPLAGRRV